jgi:hypothetical protein
MLMRFILLCLAFSLGACNSAARPPAADGLPEGARIENWRGGLATVEATFHGEGGAAVVASGTVSADGGLEFTLEPVAAAQLTGFTACPGVAVSDAALKLNSFSALNVTENGLSAGRVALASSPLVVSEGLRAVGDYYLQYTYADRPARIEGRCAVGGAPGTFSYALELARGWNPVVFKLTDSGTLRLSTAPVPAEAAWFLGEVAP